jgi:hypothetical protein
MKNFTVKCPNQQKGCEWVGSLGEAMDHCQLQGGCDYEDVYCTNNCGMCGQRKGMKQHELEECSERTYSCPHCGKVDTYSVITTHHYFLCAQYPLKCPNNCKEETIARNLLEDHLNTKCPKKKVSCRYKSLGCDVEVEREQLEKHEEISKDEHLRLAMEKVMDLSCRMEEMKKVTEQNYNETTLKIAETDKNIGSLKNKMGNLQTTVGNLQQEVRRKGSSRRKAVLTASGYQLQ